MRFIMAVIGMFALFVSGPLSARKVDVPRDGVLPADSDGYAEYVNVRYGYSIHYPAKLLIPEGEDDSGGGQSFATRDKKVELSTWAMWDPDENTAPQRLREDYQEDVSQGPDRKHHPKIAFKTFHGNWYVVSGTYDGTIFYTKHFLSGGRHVTFLISYPATQHAAWDQQVEYISKHFSLNSLCAGTPC